MIVGQKRWSRTMGESRAASGGDERTGAATVDDLLLRVARGDAAAFADLCDQVGGAVYDLVRRIVADQSAAEQVAGEVLTEVWRSAPRFSPSAGSGLSWVTTIARRRAMSHAGAAAGDGPAGRPGPSAAAMVVAERAGAGLLAHRGLASLPGPQREAVLLACCGYTWRQAADLLEVPASTVAERLRDGLLGLVTEVGRPASASQSGAPSTAAAAAPPGSR
jgi:RNA polymerase sigma-70 factor, ECF subfamily